MNSKSSEVRPGTGSGMLSKAAWSAIAESLGFTKRQIEILRGMFDGKKEAVIADELGISPHTIHTHMERIYHKLGITSRLELVQFIMAEFLRLTADMTNGVPPICGYWAANKCPVHGCDGYRADPLSPE